MTLQVPEYIQSLVPYVPGKPIEETKREMGVKKVIKLASNENPLGPSPYALKAIRKALENAHLYPDPAAYEFKKRLSKKLDVKMEEIIVGAGSNEVIDLLIRCYCQPGDSIVTPQYAFVAYRICAQIHGVKTQEIENLKDFVPDLDRILKTVKKDPKIKAVFLANPNNPTGTHIKSSELESFIKELAKVRDGSVLMVIDAAYQEYITSKEITDPSLWFRKYPNLYVLRTFSKIYGLAALRLGYGLSNEENILTLNKIRQPFNVSQVALDAAGEALFDDVFVKRSRAVNEEGMAFWKKKLRDWNVPYWNSQGNFLLIDVYKGFGKTGGEIYQSCLRKGVIFRPVLNYGMAHALRISVGLPAENMFAAKALGDERR